MTRYRDSCDLRMTELINYQGARPTYSIFVPRQNRSVGRTTQAVHDAYALIVAVGP